MSPLKFFIYFFISNFIGNLRGQHVGTAVSKCAERELIACHDATCDNPYPYGCLRSEYKKVCACKNTAKVINREQKCVFVTECPGYYDRLQCARDKVKKTVCRAKTCGMPEINCKNPKPACVCREGYVFRNNKCITERECQQYLVQNPAPVCKPDQKLAYTCSAAHCIRRFVDCRNPNRKCVCKHGKVFDGYGHCVKRKDCPNRKHKVYYQNKCNITNSYHKMSCGIKVCGQDLPSCNSRKNICVCRRGYELDQSKNECVLNRDCPKKINQNQPKVRDQLEESKLAKTAGALFEIFLKKLFARKN